MHCDEIKRQLSLFIDNQLEQAESDKVKEHLKECESCRTYYKNLIKLGEMADDFALSGDDNYWEAQKDLVIERITREESPEIVEIKIKEKRHTVYKFLAVAASIALVAFVSIYESQHIEHTSGLFDDKKTAVMSQPSPGKSQPVTDTIQEKTGVSRVREQGKLIGADKLKAEAEKPAAVSMGEVARQKKQQVLPKSAMETRKSDVMAEAPMEPSGKLELHVDEEAPSNADIVTDFEKETVPKIEPQSMAAPLELGNIRQGPSEATEKTAPVIAQKKGAIQDDDKQAVPPPDIHGEAVSMMAEGQNSSTGEMTRWQAKLDSLEAVNPDIYSPHYLESAAKSRQGMSPDSLNKVILKMAEACYQVGILSGSDKKRDEMIDKLRNLADVGNPESVEKIQFYIAQLLSAN